MLSPPWQVLPRLGLMLCVQVVLKHTHTQVFAQSLSHNKSSQATRIICFICGYTCKLHSFGHVLHASLHTFHRKSYMHCSELLLEQAACPIAYEHILQSFSLVVLVVADSLSRCHHLLVRINAHIYIYIHEINWCCSVRKVVANIH